MSLIGISLLLFAIAFVLMVIGMLLVFLSTTREGSGTKHIEGGGVVIVGPLPIVFGTSERVTKSLVILAIVLMVFVLAVFLIMNYQTVIR